VRKILHLDMDCFYAAIEERDHPELRGQPVAVGGRRRGVLTTANYEARKFGCRSAMPTFKALELCPKLILMPVRGEVYRTESAHIRAIFRRFTEIIEPLSLDEAYLDVSHLNTSGAAIAREIRSQILEDTALTASAGIAPNKLLAKIASDWNKPDGQFEIRPEDIDSFMRDLPVGRIPGVGRKMKARLAALGVQTCGDLQRFDKIAMAEKFGKWGLDLHGLCRGRDDRPVRPNRIRKSISRETTLRHDVTDFPVLLSIMRPLAESVAESLRTKHSERAVRSLVVKLKFDDFARTTAERAGHRMDDSIYESLLGEAWSRRRGRAVRLVGLGVRLAPPDDDPQLPLPL